MIPEYVQNKHCRNDLYVWTGINDILVIEAEFVVPLSNYLLNQCKDSQLPHSQTLLADCWTTNIYRLSSSLKSLVPLNSFAR